MSLYFITTALGIICSGTAVFGAPSILDKGVAQDHGEDLGKSETELPPDLCQHPAIDAITRTKDGSTYVFKGNFFWKLNNNVMSEGYPRKISEDWEKLEGDLDASFTMDDGHTYFFKRDKYWKFMDTNIYGGYPKLISKGFKGIPDNLDAAAFWGDKDKLYFFKGDKFWLYNFNRNSPAASNPTPITAAWNGLPSDSIDAAFVDNSVFYFFKGGRYFRYDGGASKVPTGDAHPLSNAAKFFSCPEASR